MNCTVNSLIYMYNMNCTVNPLDIEYGVNSLYIRYDSEVNSMDKQY